jgi:hypothetical protein
MESGINVKESYPLTTITLGHSPWLGFFVTSLHVWLVGLVIALCKQTPKHITDGWYIKLTPLNQLMVMGLKIWSLPNPGSNQQPFDHWLASLRTNCSNRAHICMS